MKSKRQEGGMVAFFTIVLIMGIMALAVGMLYNSQMNKTISQNYAKKMRSFYASDGIMTLLAQEVMDGRGKIYTQSNSLLSDNFERANSTVVGGGWIEYENGGYANIYGGRLQLNGDDSGNDPVVKKPFAKQTSGLLKWSFDMDWTYITESDYAVIMQLGSGMSSGSGETGVAVDLRWTRVGTAQGCLVDGNGNVQAVPSLSGQHSLEVLIDLDHRTWNLKVDNVASLSNRPFRNNLHPDEMRFGVVNMAQGSASGRTFDNVKLAIGGKGASDTLDFDGVNVTARVAENITNLFSIESESYLTSAAGTNPFRTLLQQELDIGLGVWTTTSTDSTWLPVTLYDYHSNCSNPEFQRYGGKDATLPAGVISPGMIRGALDGARKPVAKPCTTGFRKCIKDSCFSIFTKCPINGEPWFADLSRDSLAACINSCEAKYPEHCWYWNDSVSTWFRPSGAPGASFEPSTGRWSTLVPNADSSEWKGPAFNPADPFVTIVAYDSLPFKKHPTLPGVYYFRTDWISTPAPLPGESGAFNPLGGKGFGAELWWGGGRNYSFTMEMHRRFTFKPGLKFTFRGDDDVWVFINDTLVLDLGGIHWDERLFTVDLDSLQPHLGLVPGLDYWFDFFYAERNCCGSNIWITTNMDIFSVKRTPKRHWKRDYGMME